MRKDELRKLRALNATKEMMEKGKRYKEEKRKQWSYEGNHSGYKSYKVKVPEYDVLLRVQNLNGYIKVAVFLPKQMQKDITTPKYEIFLNVPGGEYITRELDDDGKEVRWLTAMVCNLHSLDYYSWYSYRNTCNVFISRDGLNTLNSLPLEYEGSSPKGLQRLRRWQQDQHDKDVVWKEKQQMAPWDADMKLVPEITKGFEEWMRKDAADEYFMIYEYDPKGQTVGFCTRCRKHVAISNPRHGKKAQCPSCKVQSTYKAHTRLQTLATGNYDGEIIQKFKGGIVIRSFEQRQWYRDCKDYTRPHIRTHEYARVMIWDDGTVKKYYWEYWKKKYHRWVPDKNYNIYSTYYWHSHKVKLYKKNLAALKKHSLLKQSAIDLWPTLPLPVTKYIAVERGNPAIERLAKIGMFRLAREIIDISYDEKLLDQNATELSKMLKIDKNRLNRLRNMACNIDMLRWMQYEKLANTIWPDEMIKDFGDARIKSSEFGFLKTPISFVKCHNYLMKQAAIMDESLKQTLTTWQDYFNMAEQLKMNVDCDQIARPKDLKVAHDELVLIIQSKGLEKTAKNIEKKWPKVNKQLPKLQKFEFEQGEYVVVAPKKVLDIVTEGTILKHCVHTCDYYFERISSDESYLFFLRRAKQPDMPWYTLEVEPSGNIRQKRTTGDNQNEDFKKAVPFLKKWQQFFHKQLTEEEKKLGEKADELRKENYANLRKNGNLVWHGRLAGKLLADVLEADFMAAGQ